jgi:uncharacterized phage infection (PIP) family protein YhgE
MQSESAKELKADMKLYEKTIEDIQNKLGTTDFAKNIEEATKKIEVQKSKIEGYKNAINNLSAADNETGNGANYYNRLIEKAQENIDALQSKINDWQTEQQRLNADLQQYNALLEAANKIQGSFKSLGIRHLLAYIHKLTQINKPSLQVCLKAIITVCLLYLNQRRCIGTKYSRIRINRPACHLYRRNREFSQECFFCNRR